MKWNDFIEQYHFWKQLNTVHHILQLGKFIAYLLPYKFEEKKVININY